MADLTFSPFALTSTECFGPQITNEDLERFIAPQIEQNPPEDRRSYCPECDIPMEIISADYQCAVCGFTMYNAHETARDHSETTSSTIRIATGAYRGRFYNMSCDYAKTQYKMILTLMQCHARKYTGPPFSPAIIRATADMYNHIQRYVKIEEVDENGTVCIKKFVRRGSIKDEILAAILYFECVRDGIVRKKQHAAEFMGLTTSGFSRGENILRSLEAQGYIKIPVDANPTRRFAEMYMEKLEITRAQYIDFVIDLVEESENKKIAMSSQLSSKVVGAIWILITRRKLAITAKALEAAADNTKKSTFVKFSNVVTANPEIFGHIFKRHGV